MVARIPNIVAARFGYYTSLPAANDGLVWVLFQASGLASDDVLRDFDDLAAVLAGSTNEATFGGYARRVVTSGTVTIDDTNNRVGTTCPAPTSWTSTSVQALGKIGLFYDPDIGTGTDASLIPLFFDDYVKTTPASGAVIYNVNAAGWGRAVPA